MQRVLGSIALAALLSAGASHAASTSPSLSAQLPAPAARLLLKQRDHARLMAEDAAKPRSAPLRYAVGESVAVSAEPASGKPGAKALPAGGEWSTLADGRSLWRLAVTSPGAVGLGFGFRRMFLPQGAQLWFRSADGSHVQGPYTDADNTRFGGFWSGVVPGAESVIEVALPEAMKRHLVLELGTVNHAYRDVFDATSLSAKSLNCEIDVACPEGDNYRDPIRAVARYVFQSGGSGFLCTGQLLNNSAGDRRRLFHTADHCISEQAEAESMVLYWNYQSPVCRASGSAGNGTPISDSVAVLQTGGASLRAHYTGADASLVELNSPIPAPANVYFAGWDRRASLPPSTVVIHHANGQEKRISVDFNPPEIEPLPQEIPGEGNSINLRAGESITATYDRGTTEGGSSGGGLFSNAGRVIGQLAGGPPGSCTSGITDSYGWIAPAWEGDGTSATRLRDWLDPSGGNADFLNGVNTCTGPQIDLTAPSTAVAGQSIVLSATVTGAGPFTVSWDVDDDGIADRTVAGVSAPVSLPVNFPSEVESRVRVRAVDATGCSSEVVRAIAVTGPSIGATLAGQPAQLCGNNDAVIDPGERWNVPVFVFNTLNASALNGAYAIFSRPYQGIALPVRGPDAFGYVAADDSSGCGYNFIDLEGQTAVLPLTAAPGQDIDDEAHTNVLQFGQNFDFYGNVTNSVVMSTNGYLSTSPTDLGNDYDNVCGLSPPDRDSSGGRFNVLHDDLVIGTQNQSGLRALAFANCPRPAESVAGNTPCAVFQWSHMGQYTDGGDFTFQAILYPATGQIVYQYRVAPNDLGASSTVGIQNQAVTSGLEYSCAEPAIQPKRSVCFFRPGGAPVAPPAPALRIETPAVALQNLVPGAGQTVNVPFAVRPEAACGSPLQLQYMGTVQPDASSTVRQTLVDTTIGSPTCTPTQACPAQVVAPINLADGLYFNAKRSGNGEGIFTIPVGAEKTVFSAWFTAEADRKPIWYIVQETLRDNQVVAPIFRYKQNTSSPTFSVGRSVVGTAQATWLSPTTYAFTWNLDGVQGGQLEQRLYQLAPSTTPNRTGVWYFPQQGGWGEVLDDHFLGAATEQVAVNYVYDTPAGDPRWNLGGAADINQGPINLNQFAVHCPTCPNLTDFFAVRQPAGTVTRTFSSITQGQLSTNITFQPPLLGTWVRDNVPIIMISAPQQQNP